MAIVMTPATNSSGDSASAATGLPVAGVFSTQSKSKRSYVTPDSSVSPGLRPKDIEDEHNITPDSGDETDDLDMDGFEGNNNHPLPDMHRGSPCLDPTGARLEDDPAIAPSTLADVYLPTLFAQHGPCAIRHLTQYLSVNNAKFGELHAGKQRRLIVKALELGKGVMFEKVGWGRWNQIESKMDGTPFTPETMPQQLNKSGSLLSSSLKHSALVANSSGGLRPPVLGSYPVSSYSSQQDFMFSPSLSVAETSREDEDDGDIDPLDLDLEGEDSDTDEEDWRSMGAEALRARSTTASNAGSFREPNSYLGSHSGSQRSVPYPIRRKSSAGVYQLNSPYLQSGSHSNSPMMRPSFPKTSSYLKASPMSNARASSFSKARENRVQHISPTRTCNPSSPDLRNEDSNTQADAVEALVMLSGGHQGS
ncbi:Putative uncharacterized protein [Taphrina deformans PYCC 5710]|uniref:Uncharacterized protein n=1 Tax=Taphrina deformans (strain PYCC 5710 / ATCC 11124 / CBS 356.35 / IMI 108563 / JCM 9778 / NBRC 8474) TaxID=1097556 RepID=R4XL81_TAPDE|nr:Putative uncharacterized protein [Taphrina deformans PYCC 5710]|eukprot:CCG85145.1 Putative uncharacterized protein [Taphrina deformans PYCC 5710]